MDEVIENRGTESPAQTDGLGQSLSIAPGVNFTSVFGNNLLSAEQAAAGQAIEASVQAMDGEEYSFVLFDSAVSEAAVASAGGTVAAGAVTVSGTFTAEQLTSLRSKHGRVDLDFPAAGIRETIFFTNRAVSAPDKPVLPAPVSIGSYPTVLPVLWSHSDGDQLTATLSELASPANSIQLPINSNTTLSYYVTITDTEVDDDKTYQLTLTATGRDGQLVSSTTTLVVDLNNNRHAVLLSPQTPTAGAAQTVSISDASPSLHSWWATAAKDEKDIPGTALKSVWVQDGALTTTLAGLPTDGSAYVIEIVELPETAEGKADWTNKRVTIYQFQSTAAPEISSVEDGDYIEDHHNLAWNISGATQVEHVSIKLFESIFSKDTLPVFEQREITETSITVSGLPDDGKAIHVVLETLVEGITRSGLYHFVSGGPAGGRDPAVTSVAPNSNHTSASLAVHWASGGTPCRKFWVLAGHEPNGKDIYASDRLDGTSATSHTVSGLPQDGSRVYITLSYQREDGSWGNCVNCITSGPGPLAKKAVINSPADRGVLQGVQVNFGWSENAFAADSWTIKIGKNAGEANIAVLPNIPINLMSHPVSGYSGLEKLYLNLYSVKDGVETLHDTKRVTGSRQARPSSTGYHNDIGTVRDSQHFTRPDNLAEGRLKLTDKHNLVIENFVIDAVQVAPDYLVGGIELYGCTGITIRNGFIKLPASWNKKNADGYVPVTGGITGRKCSGISVEGINTEHGHTGFRWDDCQDVTVRRCLSKDPYQHHVHFLKTGLADNHRFTVEELYGYRTGFAYSGSSMDGLNFAASPKRGGVRASVSRVLIEKGKGLNGSGFVCEGPDWGGPCGDIDFSDIVLIDTCNKGFANAGGGNNTYRRIWAFQDDLQTGTTPEGRHCGTIAAYDADFHKSTTRPPNLRDEGFGNTLYEDCRTHFVKNGKVIGFQKVRVGSTDELVFGIFYHTPPGHEPRFINCQFDADKDQETGQKNYVTPSLTRKQCRDKAKTMLVNIPCWSGFGKGSMAEANKLNESS